MLGPPPSHDHQIQGTPSEEGACSCLPHPLLGQSPRGDAESAEVARHQCSPCWHCIAGGNRGKVKRSTRSEVNMKRSVENAKEGKKGHRKTHNTRIKLCVCTWTNFLAVVTVALVFGRLVGKRDS